MLLLCLLFRYENATDLIERQMNGLKLNKRKAPKQTLLPCITCTELEVFVCYVRKKNQSF